MKHLADHRSSSTGARVKHFLKLASARGERVWQHLRQRHRLHGEGNRRVLEFVRIERRGQD